ncbi:hypothetical protein SLA2020_417760 [Shorea laevis]
MAPARNHRALILLLLLLLLLAFATPALAQCESDTVDRKCHDKEKSLKLKIIAICSILFASAVGVCLPLLSRLVPVLHPNGNLFLLVKAFASGVILATGYMHVLPDSFNDLTSPCLPENPWKKFPFTTFVAMLSAVVTLMVDSLAMSWYKKRVRGDKVLTVRSDRVEKQSGDMENFGHDQSNKGHWESEQESESLMRHRVTAQVLELGIVVHSVVIGLAMGASDNFCTIRPLIAALCFHQLFEGMGLGGCILQSEYKLKMKATMVFLFASTTPFGIALGIALSNVYSETSPTALIVVGILNACSAGLLNYMALVDLLASDFMGPKLQGSMKLQMRAYVAVLLGAGGMSLMAKWA